MDGQFTGSHLKQSSAEDELVGDMIKDWEQLYQYRGNLNSHLTEIAQRVLPMDSYLFQNFSQLGSQGDKRTFELYDSTGALSLQRFAAIVDSLLTPQEHIWHILKPQDPILRKDKATRLWFEQANNILWESRYATTANFSGQNYGRYTSLGAYGTGILLIDDLQGQKGLRYKYTHLAECYLQQNHQGMVDANCRHFMLTARQAYQMFGDSCPDQILTIKDKFPERPFYFLHWVRPNLTRDPQRKDFRGMEFSSYYLSIEGRKIVYESGYRTFPYSVSRYYQASNEAYGRSIAMDVLPSLKTLNEQKKTMLKQGHRIVDPVLLAHDDGIIDGFSLEPGAMNAGGVSKDGRLLVQPLPTGNIQAGKEMMEEEKALIEDHFLVSLYKVVMENPNMTATQVIEIVREKGILIAPTLGRQYSESIGPQIHRELDVLSKQGRLPKQPPLLKSAEGEYKIDYDSPIARTQKAEWASGAMRTLEAFQNYAQLTGDPSSLHIINMKVAGPEIARINGTPESWINTPEDILKLQQQAQQEKQQQTAIQAAPAVAGMIKAGAQANNNQGGQGQ